MILLQLQLALIAGNSIGVEINNGEMECKEVKSREWGDLETFTEEKVNPQCLGTLRMKKDGRILCIQKEESFEDYLKCKDGGSEERITTPTASSTKSTILPPSFTTRPTTTTTSAASTTSPCPVCDPRFSVRVQNRGGQSCARCHCQVRGDCEDTSGDNKGLTNNVTSLRNQIVCSSPLKKIDLDIHGQSP